MKTKFAIGNIQIGELKLENIIIEQEYNVNEVAGMMKCSKDFVKDIIKELPDVMEDVEKIMTKAEKIDNKINADIDNHEEEHIDEFIKKFMKDLGIHGEVVRISPEELFDRMHRPRG